MKHSDHLGPFGRFLCYLYVAAIGIPIFVYPGYRATNLTAIIDPDSAVRADLLSLRVHWIVAVAGLLAAYLLWRAMRGHRPAPPPRGGLLLGLVGVFAAALVAGLLLSPRWLSVVYFVQTIVPLLGFVVGSQLARDGDRLQRSTIVLVIATTASVTAIAALALSLGAFSSNRQAAAILARLVPQVRDYFPYIVATSLALAVAHLSVAATRRGRALLAGVIAIHLVFYAVTWSRMAVIMLAIVGTVPVLIALGARTSMTLRGAIVVTLALIAVPALLLSRVGVFASRFDDGMERSDGRRIEYAATAVRMIAADPLFGRMFLPDWERDPYPARELAIPRVYKAHNQYLDYGVRAGVPALIMLALIVWAAACDLLSALRSAAAGSSGRAILTAIAAALASAAVGNLTLLLLVQAQSGSLVWLLVGIVATTAQREGQADQREHADLEDRPRQ